MNRAKQCRLTFVVALALAPLAAQACGEGMFNTGKGLSYQAYLAPRPAAVLVYSDSATGSQDARQSALFAGLRKAGHTVTVVSDPDALKRSIAEQKYDVVISSLQGIDTIAEVGSAQAPALLPVVARAARNSPEVKNRFDLFLIDGSSLGQYLRAINQSIATKI